MNTEQATGNIKEIENTLLNHFNSEFAEFAKTVLESPPTSAKEVKDITSKAMMIYKLGDTIFDTIESLNKLNKGDLLI